MLGQGFNQLLDAVFAKVGQRAVRQVALSRRHIHSLSLRFHLERRTGGLAVQRRYDVEQHERQQKLDPGGAALDGAATPPVRRFEVKAQRQRVDMAKGR